MLNFRELTCCEVGWVTWSPNGKEIPKHASQIGIISCVIIRICSFRVLLWLPVFYFPPLCILYSSVPAAHLIFPKKKLNGHFSNRESGTSRDLGFFVGFEEEEATSKCSFVSARFLLRLKFKVAQTVSLWEGIFRKKKNTRNEEKTPLLPTRPKYTRSYSYDAVYLIQDKNCDLATQSKLVYSFLPDRERGRMLIFEGKIAETRDRRRHINLLVSLQSVPVN